MNNITLFIRHLLILVTALVWYFVIFYALYVSFLGSVWFFTLSWFWILIGTVILSGIVMGAFTLIAQIPIYIYLLFDYFYKSTWFSVISHSLVALYAVITVVYSYFFQDQNFDGVTGSIVSILWEYSALRTVLFFAFIIPTILSLCYIFIILPINLRNEEH